MTTKKRRGKYKFETVEMTVENALDSYSDLEDLETEMSEWRDNMEGTSLANTEKFETISQTVDTLVDQRSNLEQYVEELKSNLEELEESLLQETIQVGQAVTRSKRKYPSREVRCGNATAPVSAAVEHLNNRLDQLRQLITDGKEHEFFEVDEDGFSEEMRVQVLDDITEVEQELTEISDALGELEGAEFPGMYG